MLDDNPIADDIARMVADVDLMQRMLDIHPRRGEVSEVHHGHEIEVAFEMVAVISPGQSEQLRYTAK